MSKKGFVRGNDRLEKMLAAMPADEKEKLQSEASELDRLYALRASRALEDDRRDRDLARIALPEVVTKLRIHLGVRLVAYIGNATSTNSVAEWTSGQRLPARIDADRLRLAFQVAELLGERYSAVTIRSWFEGMNPALGDAAPARILREGEPAADGRAVVAAARSLWAGG